MIKSKLLHIRRHIRVIFKSDDELRKYFKSRDVYELVDGFTVQDEMYELEIIVTGYSRIYTQLNGSGEWIVMNSGKVVKIG